MLQSIELQLDHVKDDPERYDKLVDEWAELRDQVDDLYTEIDRLVIKYEGTYNVC